MSNPLSCIKEAHDDQRGNMLFIIFMAVILVGILTAAITNTNSGGSNIDDETMTIRVAEVLRYGDELQRAVTFVLEKGYSENDLRFAHPDADSDYGDLSADGDPGDQVFHVNGGGAAYRTPPSGVNDGSAWEFYGTNAAPNVGGATTADLMAILPNVTQSVCEKINAMIDINVDIPQDTGNGAPGAGPGDCLYQGTSHRFGDGTARFFSPANTMDTSTFEQYATPSGNAARPTTRACITCSDGSYHFFQVLLAR